MDEEANRMYTGTTQPRIRNSNVAHKMRYFIHSMQTTHFIGDTFINLLVLG